MVTDERTIKAVGELVQAAAHHLGMTGPVEFTMCRNDHPWCGVDDDYVELTEEESLELLSQLPEDQERIQVDRSVCISSDYKEDSAF